MMLGEHSWQGLVDHMLCQESSQSNAQPAALPLAQAWSFNGDCRGT